MTAFPPSGMINESMLWWACSSRGALVGFLCPNKLKLSPNISLSLISIFPLILLFTLVDKAEEPITILLLIAEVLPSGTLSLFGSVIGAKSLVLLALGLSSPYLEPHTPSLGLPLLVPSLSLPLPPWDLGAEVPPPPLNFCGCPKLTLGSMYEANDLAALDTSRSSFKDNFSLSLLFCCQFKLLILIGSSVKLILESVYFSVVAGTKFKSSVICILGAYHSALCK